MPKLLARMTQEQVRDRIATSALADEGYMQQLLSLAASRGGLYASAVGEVCRRAPDRAQEYREAVAAKKAE